MKISKSKRQLANLLIEAGVTQFPESTNWAAQDKYGWQEGHPFGFYADKPYYKSGSGMWNINEPGSLTIDETFVSTLIPDWHQTVLGRDEFDQIVAETAVVVNEPKVPSEKTKAALAEAADPAPTLDQLLHDWRNADDYAKRKQTEADDAAVMRDERWQAVQARAGEMGVTVGRCEPVVAEPEREWETHDRCVVVDSPDDMAWEGRECTLISFDSRDEYIPYYVRDDVGDTYWVRNIRRP